MDCSPPGFSVHGTFQARILEWVAISFSNAWKWKVKVKSLGRVRLLATPWTAAHQAPPSMGFSRQEYWSGVPFPSLLADPFFLRAIKLNPSRKPHPLPLCGFLKSLRCPQTEFLNGCNEICSWFQQWCWVWLLLSLMDCQLVASPSRIQMSTWVSGRKVA